MIEDIKYPIYSINIDWIQDDINLKDEIRDKEAYTYRDLPDGRCRNRMRHKNMYKEIQDEESLKEEYHTRFILLDWLKRLSILVKYNIHYLKTSSS